MIHKLFFIPFVLISITGLSQSTDSSSIQQLELNDSSLLQLEGNNTFSTDSTLVGFDVNLFFNDCAHGHSCCGAGCPCCPQLSRPQAYYSKVIYRKNNHFVKVKYERYKIAMGGGLSPVQFIVEGQGKTLSTYYSVRGMLAGYHVYSTDYDWSEFEPFKKDYELVFNENGGHFLLSKNGELMNIDFRVREQINNNVWKVGFIHTYGDKHEHEYKKFALADADNELLSPLKFDNIGEFNEFGQAKVIIKYSEGVINLNGELILPVKHHRINQLGNGMFAADDQLYDANGKLVTEERYSFGHKFSEGLISATQNDTLYYLDTAGNVMRTDYLWGMVFSDGLAAVTNGEKWGFINRKGELEIPLQFDRFEHFHKGCAPVAIGEDSNRDKWGLINAKGKYIVEPEYDEISEFRESLCIVSKRGEGSGLMDTKGRLVIPLGHNFEDTYHLDTWFPMNFCLSRGLGREYYMNWELIDQKGRSILDLKGFPSLQRLKFHEKYLPYLMVYNEGYGIIDLQGNSLIDTEYDQIRICDQYHFWLKNDTGFYSYDIRAGKKRLISKHPETYEYYYQLAQSKDENGITIFYDVNGNRADGVHPIRE